MGEIYPFQSVAATNNAAKPRRLLDQVRDRLRTKHYAYRIEQAYVDWVRRYILFHQKRHPRDMGGPEIESFLTYLATERNVAASTQTQALCALLFLYKHVLNVELPALDAVRAKRPKRLPVVLSRNEVRCLLDAVSGARGVYQTRARLMYGSGMRLMECCRLRIKDIDQARRQLVVREAKGDKDRAVPLPDALQEALTSLMAWRAEQHRCDLEQGFGRVDLPHAFEAKSPRSAFDLGWQFVFASERISRCPRTGRPGRHHLHENAIGQAVSRAARQAGLTKRVTCHTPPRRRERHPHRAGTTWTQRRSTTMICTHVLQRGACGVRSPLDALKAAAW